ncbi:MAG: DegT/DnrJ/EryC1/StrS family aminotransferase, partial [Planctomycetota bacterium]|nr:DegT/DnrJ/EryC1/StrS family aminotransferase [Planctomycetota bacterium]
GFNYRMSNLLAAVGSGQLRVLGERVAARRRIFETYRDGLDATGRIEWMPESPHGTCTRWLTCGLVADEGERDRLLAHLDSEGIEARPVWKPMHLQPLFAGRR